ncbi:MAG: hypothetical protein RM049_31625 [Nostoc sp. DedQUE04]|uniref:hypothetical protein n=1 Tax=Nostoc sp. DedQUE04 TaxID=3075390 RepID=UPI002AD20EB9|nr:hypothetical protein [Nostoc sp. DedQUE04]MDZ8139787.1 hypothetical protein [Nostoc sp. DedQUE04]
MKKNSEVRIQERSRRRSASGQNQDARSPLACRRQDSLTLRYQSGMGDPRLIVLHQIVDLVGILNPVIHSPVGL